MNRLERLRSGVSPFLLYGFLALLSFPTLGQALFGEHGLAYAHDVFDLPRSGVLQDWLAYGPTLWNTHLTGGNALLAQQATTPFAIDVLLGFAIGPFGAYAVTTWLIAVVAGVSMHLFLRDSLRLSTAAVVGGAVIYLFGFWHYIYGFGGAAIPLILWLGDRTTSAGPGRWRYVASGALVGGLLLYHAQSQVVLLIATLQIAYGLVIATDRDDRVRRFRSWFGTWLLAIAMYGPVLLTQLVMLPISQRTIWDVQALFPDGVPGALREALQRYADVVVGVPVGSGLGASASIYGTFFLGAIGLPLVVLAAVHLGRDRRERFFLLLLLVIPALDLLAIVATPIQDQLGFLKSFQFVRVRHLYPFVLVVVAAFGLDRLVASLVDGRRIAARRWQRAVLGLSMIPLVVALVVSARHVLRSRHQILALDTASVGWALLLVALVVGSATIAGVLVLGMRRGGASSIRVGRWAGAILGILLIALAGERVVYAYGERFVDGHIATWAETLDVTPGQAFLLDQPGADIDRVLTFGDQANRMGAVGLLQVDGYQAIYPLTYHAFFGALIGPQLANDPAIATYYGSWGNRATTFGPNVDPELVALASARWLYVRGTEVPTVPGIVPRFRDGDVTVYEVPSVLPRAFVAGGVVVGRDLTDIVERLSSADLATLHAKAFVDGPGAGLLGATGLPDDGPAGDATVASYTPDRVEIDVHATRPGILVLADVMAPGWVASRDGVDIPIATVDGTFRGVPVDAATHRVVFRYVPTFTYLGFGLAFAALLGAIAWAWATRRRERVRPDPPGPASPG